MNKIIKLTCVTTVVLASAVYSMDIPHLNEQLIQAVTEGNTDEVRRLISAGAQVNIIIERQNIGFPQSPLTAAVRANNPGIIQLLFDNGALVELQDKLTRDALFFAVTSIEPNRDIIMQLLTHIPLDEQTKIKNTLTAIGLFKRHPKLNRDVRKLITQQIIDQFVNQQIERIKILLAKKYKQGLTARDWAIFNAGAHNNFNFSVPYLLDLNNPKSIQTIRNAIERNIRKILFALPVPPDGNQ